MTSATIACVNFIGMVVLNALSIPITMAYTAAVSSLPATWKLTHIDGIHYLWWSMAEDKLKGPNNVTISYVGSTPVSAPRTTLVLFVLTSPVLLIAALISACCARAERTKTRGYDYDYNRPQPKKYRKRK